MVVNYPQYTNDRLTDQEFNHLWTLHIHYAAGDLTSIDYNRDTGNGFVYSVCQYSTKVYKFTLIGHTLKYRGYQRNTNNPCYLILSSGRKLVLD